MTLPVRVDAAVLAGDDRDRVRADVGADEHQIAAAVVFDRDPAARVGRQQAADGVNSSSFIDVKRTVCLASDAPMNTRSFVPSGMRMVCGQESTQFSR